MREWIARFLSCLALAAALVGCGEADTNRLPPLLASDPEDGSETVPRTAWIRLTFATPIGDTDAAQVELACGGAPRAAANMGGGT